MTARQDAPAPRSPAEAGPTTGFFTDPTVCIGCKACEVACKEWNDVPSKSPTGPRKGRGYDHTAELGASSWRHVAFVEREVPLTAAGVVDRTSASRSSSRDESGGQSKGESHGTSQGTSQVASQVASPGTLGDRSRGTSTGMPVFPVGGSPVTGGGALSAMGANDDPGLGVPLLEWVFLSDVCKHCEHAGCLEACPTGSIVRTGAGAVYVQEEVCNGCGYCVVGCPFGVIDRRPHEDPGGGGAYKCTLCSDRQADGLLPACARACPTDAIQFGELGALRAQADARVARLHADGRSDITLYDAADTSVGGAHAFFLVPGDPLDYGLPQRPAVPTEWMGASWLSAALTSVAAFAAIAIAFGMLP